MRVESAGVEQLQGSIHAKVGRLDLCFYVTAVLQHAEAVGHGLVVTGRQFKQRQLVEKGLCLGLDGVDLGQPCRSPPALEAEQRGDKAAKQLHGHVLLQHALADSGEASNVAKLVHEVSHPDSKLAAVRGLGPEGVLYPRLEGHIIPGHVRPVAGGLRKLCFLTERLGEEFQERGGVCHRDDGDNQTDKNAQEALNVGVNRYIPATGGLRVKQLLPALAQRGGQKPLARVVGWEVWPLCRLDAGLHADGQRLVAVDEHLVMVGGGG